MEIIVKKHRIIAVLSVAILAMVVSACTVTTETELSDYYSYEQMQQNGGSFPQSSVVYPNLFDDQYMQQQQPVFYP